MVPILHCESIHLVDNKNLNRRQEIGAPAVDNKNGVPYGMGRRTRELTFAFQSTFLTPKGLQGLSHNYKNQRIASRSSWSS